VIKASNDILKFAAFMVSVVCSSHRVFLLTVKS